jgi:hypothetical protein
MIQGMHSYGGNYASYAPHLGQEYFVGAVATDPNVLRAAENLDVLFRSTYIDVGHQAGAIPVRGSAERLAQMRRTYPSFVQLWQLMERALDVWQDLKQQFVEGTYNEHRFFTCRPSPRIQLQLMAQSLNALRQQARSIGMTLTGSDASLDPSGMPAAIGQAVAILGPQLAISGGPQPIVSQSPASDAALLSYVLAYLNKKNGTTSAVVSTNPFVQAIASAARGIFATAADTRFIEAAIHQMGMRQLAQWAAGEITPNEAAHPQWIAATLLWADTWKRGS